MEAWGICCWPTSHFFVCETSEVLVERLVWARGAGYVTATARRCSELSDRPLLPSEAVRLVKDAMVLALRA